MEIRELQRDELDEFVEELFIPFATEVAEHDSALALISTNVQKRAREYWEEWFEDDEKHVLVAVNGGDLVAYASIKVNSLPPMFEAGPEMHVMEFYVKASHRRREIGTVLMAEVEQTATQHDCERVSLFVHIENESAKQFYKKFDFTEERYRMTKMVPD